MSHYLDNAATTPVRPEAVQAALDAMQSQWGNPSSQYALGQSARDLLDSWRRDAAQGLGCAPEEFYFTSGGTEGDNWAIAAAAELGCIAAGGSEVQRAAVRTYAEKLGLAFQIRDDMLDVTATAEELGKPIGSDAESGKSTFVTLKGLDECGELVERLTGEAEAALAGFESPEFLLALARSLVDRKS